MKQILIPVWCVLILCSALLEQYALIPLQAVTVVLIATLPK